MAFDTALRRGFPIVVVSFVGVAAYLQARAAMQLVGAALIQTAKVAGQWVDRSMAHTPPPKSGQAIVENNPFDSSARSLTERHEEASKPALADVADPLSWPDCEGVQLLIVTQSSDPWWSMSTLRWPGETRARLRRVGDDVAGKQVAFIGYNPKQLVPAVWLTGAGTFCQSALFRPSTPPTVPAASPPLGDGQVRVERSLVDSTLRDPRSLIGAVRVFPEMKDGVTIGLRLSGIRPSSLLAQLGLKNGDRLESINGFSVASPEQALQAYARLRSAARLNVRLQRGGQPLEINLNII
jgi:general secretion pathway protein C